MPSDLNEPNNVPSDTSPHNGIRGNGQTTEETSENNVVQFASAEKVEKSKASMVGKYGSGNVFSRFFY